MSAPLWTLARGATVMDDGSTRFTIWAPRARRVSVRVHDGPATGEHPLIDTGGVHETVVREVGAGADYAYRLDDGPERPDPVSRHQPAGVHGPSRIVDPGAFRWSDDAWVGVDLADLVVYELHIGTFTPEGTFAGAVERLPYLRDLGVTAIELMPVAAFPGRRNWGYDGVDLYAPQESYGGPDGLRRLVDRAHDAGLAVLLDVVYNHLGPEGNYLEEFGPYFTDRYRTPWGRALNFDGPGSDEVRRYFIENALHWISEYHIDGLRLDAVHAIFDFSARHILEELADEVHAQAAALGRRVHVIAESDLNDPRLVRSKDRGGYGLDAQWNDDFHHAVHAALTGERDGYYVDFGGIEPVRKALSDRFVLDGRYSRFRGRRHGALARDLPAERFVVFVQNHDQVGNRASGKRLTALVSPAELRLAAALVLLSPYVPLLFMGEEYGETRPFLYFVDHEDPELRDAVRRGREREFQRFNWSRPIPDPAAPETFRRSRLDFSRVEEGPGLLKLYRDLIRLRRERPPLRPGASRITVSGRVDEGWLNVLFAHPGASDLLATFNLSHEVAELEAPGAGPWRTLLSTDDATYGGPADPASTSDVPSPSDAEALVLPPLSGSLLERGSS